MNVESIDRARYETALKENPTLWDLYIPLAKLYSTPLERSHILLKGAWHALEKKEYERVKTLSEIALGNYGNTFRSRVIEIELLRAQKQEDRIPEKLLEIAKFFKNSGFSDQAVKAYKRLALLDRNPATYQKVIDLYVKIGKGQKAAQWKEGLACLTPPRPVPQVAESPKKTPGKPLTPPPTTEVGRKAKPLVSTLTNSTPTRTTEQNRHVEVINTSPETTVNQNQVNSEGITPLGLAAPQVSHLPKKTVRDILGLPPTTEVGHEVKPLVSTLTNPTPIDVAGNTRLQSARIAAKSQRDGDGNDQVNSEGITPLVLAAREGDITTLNKLLKAGANIDQVLTREGWTPLCIAADHGHVEFVKALLKAGANKDHAMISGGGFSPLFLAAAKGHVAVVHALLKARANKDLSSFDEGTPLCIAAKNGHIEVVDALLKAGANINQVMARGNWTPLCIAADNGHFKVVKALLRAGANKNKAGLDERTPLYLAAEKGHVAIVKTLLRAGANKDQSNLNGTTPLRIAQKNQHNAVTKALLQGDGKDEVDSAGRTSLYVAAEQGHIADVNALLEAGADEDQAAFGGFTPLCAASQKGHVAIVEILLKAGANKDQTTLEGGHSPLWIAALAGHVAVVKTLLKAEANKDLADSNGITPLWIAAEKGHAAVVKALLKAGANKDLAGTNGKTPLRIAELKRHTAVVNALKAAGAKRTTLWQRLRGQ